jgi:ubiquinone/menaquinone biosynthesis C-methylase UbiE
MNRTPKAATSGAAWLDIAHSGISPAESYECYFVAAIGAPLAADLIEKAALQSGERLLDVACGTGVVARLAAERVGASGAVTGADLNPDMIKVARSLAPPKGAITWQQADAASMPFPDESFDVVLCQLGLQFVQDRDAALREMRRVMAPGGRAMVSLPGPVAPLFAAVDQVFARHLGPQAAGFIRAVFSLYDPVELRELFVTSGFHDVEITEAKATLQLPPPAQFLWQYVHSTPLVAAAMAATDDARAALEQEIVGEWKKFETRGGMTYQQNVVTVAARK